MKVDGLTNDEVKSHLQVTHNLSFLLLIIFRACNHERNLLLYPTHIAKAVVVQYHTTEHLLIVSTLLVMRLFFILYFTDYVLNFCLPINMQKYRLHTRRPSPSPQAAGGHAPQLVVLGGIWVPPEYASAAAAAHGGAPTIYSTHPTTQVSSHYCSPTVPADFYPQPSPPSQAHPQALHHPALQHHHHQQQLHVYKTASHTQTHSSPESDAQRAGDRSESIEDGKSDSSSWKGESGDNEERKKLAAMREDGEESNGSEITLKF